MRFRSAAMILFLICTLIAPGPAEAGSSGVVVDSRFFPLPGAQVCLVEGDETGPCVMTDGGGEYILPDSEMTRVEVTLAGFIPTVVPAVDHVNPVRLERAASILVVFLDDLTGESLTLGQFWLDNAAGVRVGPFPVSASGTRVKSLRPGSVAVRGEIAGYRQEEPFLTELFSGNETQIEVRLSSSNPAR
ncbi:MAG: hypothetical protein IFK94_10415 [Acidobacteria bacterium]|uniref:Carboxypeptidase regulatory-like domain-containing protein n=1 Tax=Candidatus Polarisedimenticola svalbardensis TaxID=2886004 RepID=A0A8J6Y3E6_9BACT|nr:hypothetical protein [Candidatus Polarisedimenticola svalbardensis]